MAKGEKTRENSGGLGKDGPGSRPLEGPFLQWPNESPREGTLVWASDVLTDMSTNGVSFYASIYHCYLIFF